MNYLSEPRVGELNYHDLGAIRTVLMLSTQIEREYATQLQAALTNLQRKYYSEGK